MTEEHVPNERTRQSHRRRTKWRRDRQSTQERVQGNDCKDDQRTQEKNGPQSEKLEVFNKELENRKDNQTEMKNTITEIKNTLEEISSKLNDTEKRTSKLEDRVVEITDVEQKKQKKEWKEIRKV